MSTVEQELREFFHAVPAARSVDATAILERGHRQLRAQRLRSTTAVAVPAVVALTCGGLVVAGRETSPYELAGSGLTLAAGTVGPVQVSGDRVDLGDGVQAWRHGTHLYIGYPARPYAELDTNDLTSRWGHLSYDTVVFDGAGQHDGSTVVVGTVRGTPSNIVVTVEGVSQTATIACFEQAAGWCSYMAKVPTSIQSYDDTPTLQVTS